MSELIIIRGLPGSGKSTLARMLQTLLVASKVSVMHIEADEFWMKDGIYKFEAERAKDAHENCCRRTTIALAEGKTVIVANTFTTREELAPYMEFCFRRDIPYRVITLEPVGVTGDISKLEKFTIHGVPVETLEKMKARWEHELD